MKLRTKILIAVAGFLGLGYVLERKAKAMPTSTTTGGGGGSTGSTVIGTKAGDGQTLYQPTSSRTYTVVTGDTLDRLSSRFLPSVPKLTARRWWQQLNTRITNVNMIKTGWTLNVPDDPGITSGSSSGSTGGS